MSPLIEHLEDRIAPAGVVFFTDVDGDRITIETSLGNDNALLDAITGDTIIREIDLSKNAIFDGTDLTITAVKMQPQGDGLVRIGYIDAAASNGSGAADGVNLHLGHVVVDGDLGQIDVGVDDGVRGLQSLSVFSIGRFASQSMGTVSNISTFLGKTGPITVTDSVTASSLMLNTGGGFTAGGDFVSSNLHASTKMAFVKIAGDLVGAQADTGQITGGDFGKVKVRGSVIGGSDNLGAPINNSGRIAVTGDLGPVRIGGQLIGVAPGDHVAEITAGGNIEQVTIRGSVIAPNAADTGFSNSAKISAGGNIGPLFIGGDMRGANTPVGSGDVNDVAVIRAGGSIASITIGGSIAAGHDFSSVNAVSITAGKEIGFLTVNGGINGTGGVGVNISAGVADQPVSGKLKSIGPISIGKSMQFTTITAGTGTVKSEDAQIGRVTIGGSFVSSSIAAGVVDGSDQPGLFSKIGPVTVGGHVVGDTSGGTFFGFTAQEIRSATISGEIIPLNPGRGNDTTPITLGNTVDVRITELPA